MRIVAFVGSPLDVDEGQLTKLAKRLKKEKVNVDIINFGEEVRFAIWMMIPLINIVFLKMAKFDLFTFWVSVGEGWIKNWIKFLKMLNYISGIISWLT